MNTIFIPIFVAKINPKFMILAIFRLNPNHIEFSMVVSCIDLIMSRWLVILWFIASKYDGWALVGARAAIRINMVNIFVTTYVRNTIIEIQKCWEKLQLFICHLYARPGGGGSYM